MMPAAASASTGFLGVDWGSIALVFVVALAAVVVIVSFYSLGLRLLAHGSPVESENNGALKTTRDQRPLGATVGGVACIGVGVVGVLYGIYLVVPVFH